MAERRCEFVDSRLRRYPPDRAGAVPYGQAGENALRFPHLAHRSAAVHKLHSATATSRIEFDSLIPGKVKPSTGYQPLAHSSRNLSKRPRPPQPSPDQVRGGMVPAIEQRIVASECAGYQLVRPTDHKPTRAHWVTFHKQNWVRSYKR